MNNYHWNIFINTDLFYSKDQDSFENIDQWFHDFFHYSLNLIETHEIKFSIQEAVNSLLKRETFGV